MSLIGYARVSSAEGRQVLDRQLDALNEAGCERVFEDRASGAATDRPKLAACLDHLRQSDVLVVLDLDRLGRRAGELIALIDELDRRGVGFRALNSPMDTTTPAGRAFMQIQAAFAEMERNVMRQRIREGVKAARARGRKGGRPRVMTHEKLRYAQNLMADRTRSIPDYLPRTRQHSHEYALPLPARRRNAQGAGATAPCLVIPCRMPNICWNCSDHAPQNHSHGPAAFRPVRSPRRRAFPAKALHPG